MKSPSAIALAVLLAVPAHAETTQEFLARFRWRQPIDGTLSAGKLVLVPATADVFDGCREFPLDLRVVTPDGRQWPFYLWVPAGRHDSQFLTVRRLGGSDGDGGCRQEVLQVPTDERTGERRAHNRVVVRTPGREFARRVEVYGSEDQAGWTLLGSGCLVNHQREAQAVNNAVPYPDSTLPFLQVRVYPDAKEPDETFSIQGVFVAHELDEPGETEAVKLAPLPVPPGEVKDGSQVLLYDAGGRSRPVERLTVRAGDAEYARAVRAYGRNDSSNAWRWVGDGEIHRVGKATGDEIELKFFAFRFLKLEIVGSPLSGVEVSGSAAPRYLVIEPADSGPAALVYGSLFVPPARYDLARRTDPKAVAAAPRFRLAARADNTAGGETWIARRATWIAIVVVVLVGAYALRKIGRMVRRSVRERDD